MIAPRATTTQVLLVVDVQNGVMRDAWDSPRIIANIALAVERARARAIPVIWIQHTDDELVEGSAAWQFVPQLAPQPGETVIHKHFNSAFENTDLPETLTRLAADQILLAGAATNWCIRATAYAALERGYDLTLIEDAHTTSPIERQDGRTIDAESIIDELNVALKWSTYANRRNTTIRAAQIGVTTPAS